MIQTTVLRFVALVLLRANGSWLSLRLNRMDAHRLRQSVPQRPQQQRSLEDDEDSSACWTRMMLLSLQQPPLLPTPTPTTPLVALLLAVPVAPKPSQA